IRAGAQHGHLVAASGDGLEQLGAFLLVANLPDAQSAIDAGADELSWRRELQRGDPAPMALWEAIQQLAAGHVPEDNLPVLAAGDTLFPVGTEGNAGDAAAMMMPAQLAEQRLAGVVQVPEPCLAVGGSGQAKIHLGAGECAGDSADRRPGMRQDHGRLSACAVPDAD